MSSFISAAAYADKGYSLLDVRNRWDNHYPLCLALRQSSAEMHHSYGNHKMAQLASHDVVMYARDIEHKLAAFRVDITTMFALQNFRGAIKHCTTLLRQELGIILPKNASKADIIRKLLQVKMLLRGRKAGKLLSLPAMTNKEKVCASCLLNDLTIAAFMTNENELFTVACLVSMCETLKHGISQYSATAFAVFASTLSHLGIYQQAYEFGCLAIQAEALYGMDGQSFSRTHLTVHGFLRHLRQPILASMSPLDLAYRRAIHSGSLTVAGQILLMKATLAVHLDMRLDHIEAEFRGFCRFFQDNQFDTFHQVMLPIFQLVLNLSGKAEDPLVLSGEAVDERTFAIKHKETKNFVPLVLLQNCRMILYVTLDELELAGNDLTRKRMHTNSTHHSKFCDYFLCAITYLGLARKRNSRHYQSKAKTYHKKLKKRVRFGSVNCVPFVHLLDAETMSLRPYKHNHNEIVCMYQDAISAASRCGFRLYKALAYEKTGQYLLRQCDRSLASSYLQDAWSEYASFGSTAKLTQMRRKYEGIVRFENKNI